MTTIINTFFALQSLKTLWLLTLIFMPANKNQKLYIHPAFILYKSAVCTTELLLPLPDHFTGLIFNFRQPTFIPLPPGDRKMSTYQMLLHFQLGSF